ncbi:MAG: lytic transglycosylase domain-containing protein [Candidatus Eremiobacteraeota bacterium]|nr:lytic transglycosylase domain-containing protein [Candidatus Eremiobacteraeota bacterium]
MTAKLYFAAFMLAIFACSVFTAPASAQQFSQEDQNPAVVEAQEESAPLVIDGDMEQLIIRGIVEEKVPGSQGSGKDVSSTGNWNYTSDEAYLNFPSLYITVLKKVPLETEKSSATPGSDHRRRSLSSRSGTAERAARYVRKKVREDISPIILRHAKLYGVNPYIIKAIIEVESSFNPSAISCSGACGLMQLKPSTAFDMGIFNYWNPEKNIEAGTKYIRLMLDKFGNLKTALAAYNQGPGAVSRAGNVPPNNTARHYIWKVLKALEK